MFVVRMFVAMKVVVPWDMTPCRLVEMCNFPRKVFIIWTEDERWRQQVLPKCRWKGHHAHLLQRRSWPSGF